MEGVCRNLTSQVIGRRSQSGSSVYLCQPRARKFVRALRSPAKEPPMSGATSGRHRFQASFRHSDITNELARMALPPGQTRRPESPYCGRIPSMRCRRRARSRSAAELRVTLFSVQVPGTRLVPETLPALKDPARQVVFLRRGSHNIIAVAQYLSQDLCRKRAYLHAMLLEQHALRFDVGSSEFRERTDVSDRGGILHDRLQISLEPFPGLLVHRELNGGTGLMEPRAVVVSS